MTQDYLSTAHWRKHPNIDIGQIPLISSFGTKFAAFGSCFALNLKRAIDKYGFQYWYYRDVCAHYSADSMAQTLERVANHHEYNERDLFIYEGEGIVQLYQNHVREKFYGQNAIPNALTKARAIVEECRKEIEDCDVFIATLGTARVFYHSQNDDVMCFLDGVPREAWYSRMVGVDETVERLRSIHRSIAKIRHGRPFAMIVTISPQRYLFSAGVQIEGRDRSLHNPFIDNMLSKSTLVVAAHRFAEEMAEQNAHYFPAYEIVIDELRILDSIAHYDFCHIDQTFTPPKVAHRFIDSFFSQEMIAQIGFFEQLCEIEDDLKKELSRPLPSTLTNFMDKMEAALDEGEARIAMSWQKELAKVESILGLSQAIFVHLNASDVRYLMLHDRMNAFIARGRNILQAAE